MTNSKIMLIGILILTMFFGIAYFVMKNEQPDNSIKFVDYPDIITAIDEDNRLHIINLSDGTSTIYSDSITQNINSQIALRLYNKYSQKVK